MTLWSFNSWGHGVSLWCLGMVLWLHCTVDVFFRSAMFLLDVAHCVQNDCCRLVLSGIGVSPICCCLQTPAWLCCGSNLTTAMGQSTLYLISLRKSEVQLWHQTIIINVTATKNKTRDFNEISHRGFSPGWGECWWSRGFDVHHGAQAPSHTSHCCGVVCHGWCHQWASSDCWCYWCCWEAPRKYLWKKWVRVVKHPENHVGSGSVQCKTCVAASSEWFFRLSNWKKIGHVKRKQQFSSTTIPYWQ